MKEQIKELRVRIDGLSQLTKNLKQSDEIKDCTKSLLLGKCWLGKVMEELGAENPYKSGYKTVADIEPTADKSEIVAVIGKNVDNKSYKDFNHIEKVDWLRTEIEKLVLLVKEIPVGETIKLIDVNNVMSEQSKFVSFSREFAIARTNAYNYLCEARFALGFELSRCKKEHENKR